MKKYSKPESVCESFDNMNSLLLNLSQPHDNEGYTEPGNEGGYINRLEEDELLDEVVVVEGELLRK